MRKGLWIFGFLFVAIVLLSACGAKSQEDVTEALKKKVESLDGYKAEAKMTLTVGSEPQTYEIDVWHQKPDNYRVHLKKPDKEQSQMIVRNKSGVYVLTPSLNKSYRFQSEWPDNGSQAYLYGSIVKDVLEDKEAKFTADENNYVFLTKTRYQNSGLLPTQEITFNKKTLEPVSVKVMDTNQNPVLTVEFSKVEFNAKFDPDSFDTKKSMTTAQLDMEVLASPQENEDFTVKYSTADIPGVDLYEEKTVTTENGTRVLLSYTGEKSFTLVQETTEVVPASMMEVVSMNGEIVDLGFTFGALSDNSIRWTEDGVEYLLVSTDLSREELVMVAQSVQGGIVK